MTVRGVFLLIRLTRRRGRRAADYMRDRCRGQVLRDSRVSADRHAEDHMDRAFTRSRFAGGSGFSDDFASAVAAVGGTVERLHQGAGFAVVSGLSTAGARSWLPTSALRRWTPTPWSHAIRQCRRRSRRHRPSAARAVRTLRVRSIRRTRSCFPGSEYAAIRANVAWANGKLGDPGVTVAIIDSGIDYDDPDASGLMI